MVEIYNEDAMSDSMIRKGVTQFNEGQIRINDEAHKG